MNLSRQAQSDNVILLVVFFKPNIKEKQMIATLATHFASDFDVYHTPHHWANGETVAYIKNIILPSVEFSPNQHVLVIFNVFRGHLVAEADSILEENKLLIVVVPSNYTDRQPLDEVPTEH